MVRGSKVLIVAAALVAVCHLRSTVFVAAPPSRKAVTAAHAAGLMGGMTVAAPAFADAIDVAAEKLSTAAYPFLSEVPWASSTYGTLPEVKDPLMILKFIYACLDMGSSFDSVLPLRAGVLAHSKAISSINAKGVTSLEDFTAINSAIGHMVASVGKAKTMGVYDAGLALVPSSSGVPNYLMSTVNADDAKAAYTALLAFADVVQKNGAA